MSSIARLAVVFSLVSLLPAPAAAAPAPAPSKEDIARWVKQLGADEFAAREEATKKLWQAGRAAEAALQEALNRGDPEIARRARELLDKFKWGIYADTPPKVVELITRYQAADRSARPALVKELFDQGGPGCAALVKVAAAEEDADTRRSVFQQVGLEAARAVPVLLAEDNHPTLEDLVELIVASEMEAAVPSYAAYYLLRGRLDDKIAHWKPLADKPGSWRAAEILAHLHRAKGDLASARAAAEKANRADLVEAILMEQRDWKELARRQPRRDDYPFEALGYKAAYHRLAGSDKTNRDELEAVLVDLRARAEKARATGSDTEARLAVKALFLNNRPADALALLTGLKEGQQFPEGPNIIAAFEVLVAQMKYREALALAEKVPENDRAPGFEVLRARTLHMLGERDKAQAIFTALAKQIREGDEAPWHDSLVLWQWRLGLREQAFEHLARALAVTKSTGNQARLLERVFPRSGETAAAWWRFLSQKYAGEGPAAMMKRLRDLRGGKLGARELTALAEEAERSAKTLNPDEHEQLLTALAESCRAAGLDAQARDYFEKAAKVEGAPAALTRLGDYLAGKKLWEQAAEAYNRAWEKNRADPLPLHLRGAALVQAGQEKEGRKLMDLAHWLPLGDESRRAAFADELFKRGQAEAGRRERDLLLKTSQPGSFYSGEALRQVGVEALLRKDYLRAADCHELAMLRVLQGSVNFVETAALVGVPHFVHRLRARGLAEAGKLDEARREIELCLAAQPGNVELAILLVPVLEKQGRKQEADDLLGKLVVLHDQVGKDYPRSAANHNSLAWMLACCRRQLDKALAHANQAVELAPEQAGYLDTLAEVHFQRGDQAKAIELMKKCVAMEPGRGFFRKQLKRFEAGDPAVDVPSPIEDE